MKKVYLFGAIASAALAMTSCTSDETFNNDEAQSQAIEFGTYLGRDAQTRGAVTDINTLKGPFVGFGVFAAYTAQKKYDNASYDGKMNFMYDEHVTFSNDTWTYSPLKYWPNNTDDKVSFFAYAPYNETGVSIPAKENATGNPKVTFTVQDNVLEQKDLTVATALLDLTKPNIAAKTTFDFMHVLARVGFNVEAMFDKVNSDATGTKDNNTTADNGTKANETTIKVTSVKLIGKFDKTATIDLAKSEWSDVAAPTTDVTFAWDATDFEDGADNVTTDKKRLNKESRYAMLIPQQFETSNGIKIEVTYTVTTEDGKLPDGKSEITNTITSDPFTFNFEQGKAYMFNLHLGMTSVKFDASVSNWDNGSETVVNLPNNTQGN